MAFFFSEYHLLWRYLRFCITQMRKVMTTKVVPLKQYNNQSRISLEILKQCSSNLAPETNIMKEGKWHPSCCCHDNSYAAGPVLIKTKIPRFYLKQGSSTPNNLMGRGKTIWEPCVFGKDPLSHFKGLEMGIFGFPQKETGPRVLPWQQLWRCHSLPFVMHISGAKFEEHCFNICGLKKSPQPSLHAISRFWMFISSAKIDR